MVTRLLTRRYGSNQISLKLIWQPHYICTHGIEIMRKRVPT